MKPITQTKFWQLPFVLKLIVIWFFILGINKLWKIKVCLGEKECVLGDGSILFGIILIGLAIGLINKSDESRAYAAFVLFLYMLGGLFTLAVVVFEGSQLPKPQAIVVVVAFLVLNAAFLFVLMRPATKTFFMSPANLESKQ